MELRHNSVLLNETITNLNIKTNGIYVDATLGGGGHAQKICEKLSENGVLIGIDQDQFAMNLAIERLKDYPCKKYYIKDNFSNLKNRINGIKIEKVDGFIFDLGVSSFQLDDSERGFSYQRNGPLDMRMDETKETTAHQIINEYSEEAIKQVLYKYGEESFAPLIAKAIIKKRKEKEISTTFELRDIVEGAYPNRARFKERHPARKTFQAIRLEVNQELEILTYAFEDAVTLLNAKGRLCIITFHSLEDRIAKVFIKEKVNPCTCPPGFPVCVCNNVPSLKAITRKPIIPSKTELADNRRARSSKLRVAEKI